MLTKKKRLNENHTFLSLCCCLSMKLVVNVISLFFSDKSVPIDGYQGNANPIFISIILILCIIYIYISYSCLPLKSSLKDVVFRNSNLRFRKNSLTSDKTRSFKTSVVGLLAIAAYILYNIMQYCEHFTQCYIPYLFKINAAMRGTLIT